MASLTSGARRRRRKATPGLAGAPFVPTDITGLISWHRASTTTENVGDPVPSWTDDSGTGNTLTQAVAAQRPTIQLVSGARTLRFNGSMVGQQTSLGYPDNAFTALAAAEIFLVLKVDADPPPNVTDGGIWKMSSNAGIIDFYPFNIDSSIYTSFGSTTQQGSGNPATPLTDRNVFNISTAAANYTVRLNAVQLSTTGVNTVGFPVATELGSYQAGDII